MKERLLDKSLRLIRQAGDSDRCIEWPGHRTRRGYGRMHYAGKNGVGAHRVIFQLTRRPLGPAETVDHVCWNPACINPRHLRALGRDPNTRRQRSAEKTHCTKGHQFTPENTYRKSSSGARSCRACNRAAVARYKARRAA